MHGDLDLEGIVIGSARGRKKAPLTLEYVRDITSADIDTLLNPEPLGSTSDPIAKLRHSHHMAARLLAEGRKPGEVALATGYAPSRISVLQNDPMFKELIEYYKSNVEAQYLDVHSRLAAAGLSAIDYIQEEMEAGTVTIKEAITFAELCLDRSITKDTSAAGAKGAQSAPITNLQITFVKSARADAPVLSEAIELEGIAERVA